MKEQPQTLSLVCLKECTEVIAEKVQLNTISNGNYTSQTDRNPLGIAFNFCFVFFLTAQLKAVYFGNSTILSILLIPPV